ncbi:MAG: YceI family protein [Hyphomicrobiaceae bacterium]
MLKRRAIAIASFVLLAAAFVPWSALADNWRLDPDHTDIHFSWDHLGLSRQSGTITDVSGRLSFTPTDPAAAKVEFAAQVASLSTGVAALDEVLRSRDYFDARSHPRITFESTEVTPVGERQGVIRGQLTIRGIAHEVVLNTTWNYTGEHPLAPYNPVYRGQWVSGFTATSTINRSRWGLTLAAPLVSDEIQLVINAEFIRID